MIKAGPFLTLPVVIEGINLSNLIPIFVFSEGSDIIKTFIDLWNHIFSSFGYVWR
jgi:hypothetical protein